MKILGEIIFVVEIFRDYEQLILNSNSRGITHYFYYQVVRNNVDIVILSCLSTNFFSSYFRIILLISI